MDTMTYIKNNRKNIRINKFFMTIFKNNNFNNYCILEIYFIKNAKMFSKQYNFRLSKMEIYITQIINVKQTIVFLIIC